MLAIARRRPDLAEVMQPEVLDRLDWASRDPRERARIAFLVGIVWGIVLHDNVSDVEPDIWRLAMVLINRALATDTELPDGEWQPEVGDRITSRTGDALRDALVDSAAAVIGQVGLQSTTVSRVGRRAGLTAGAVYTQYASKDDLLIDSIRVLSMKPSPTTVRSPIARSIGSKWEMSRRICSLAEAVRSVVHGCASDSRRTSRPAIVAIWRLCSTNFTRAGVVDTTPCSLRLA